jgi:hypothetical protein
MFKDDYPELKGNRSVKVEITPDKGYLYPEKSWSLTVDEEVPAWWTDTHEKEARKAHRQWKKEIYSLINLKEAINLINPLSRKRKPTEKDIQLLKDWASVRDSVWDSVRDSVWDSVGASVWDSVWASVRDSVWDNVGDSVRASVWTSARAYAGSLFYIWEGQYKFQPAVDLWKRGFVASFDGTTWLLHSGKKAEIVFSWNKDEKGV